MLVSLVPIILIFVIFWLLLIRPQQKKQKEHQKLLTTLKKGDRVVTNSGMFGTISAPFRRHFGTIWPSLCATKSVCCAQRLVFVMAATIK